MAGAGFFMLFGTILILKKYVLRFYLNRDTIKKWEFRILISAHTKVGGRGGFQ